MKRRRKYFLFLSLSFYICHHQLVLCRKRILFLFLFFSKEPFVIIQKGLKNIEQVKYNGQFLLAPTMTDVS